RRRDESALPVGGPRLVEGDVEPGGEPVHELLGRGVGVEVRRERVERLDDRPQRWLEDAQEPAQERVGRERLTEERREELRAAGDRRQRDRRREGLRERIPLVGRGDREERHAGATVTACAAEQTTPVGGTSIRSTAADALFRSRFEGWIVADST